MCTLILLRRTNSDWPILIAANRDERKERTWRPPGRHWPEFPEIIAGMDQYGGGSWIGVNRSGVTALILNRQGSLGPQENKRSRGEIVIEALTHQDACTASEAIIDLNTKAYRDFNLLLTDNTQTYWIRLDSTQSSKIQISEIPDGLWMLTSGNLNDFESPRIKYFLSKFQSAATPKPDKRDWLEWITLLQRGSTTDNPEDGMCFQNNNFGTISSSLIALPSVNMQHKVDQPAFEWLFAGGSPDSEEYSKITI
jgi:uncharacterized protein with NRDE domain